MHSRKLGFVFFLALLIRLVLIPHPGFKADIAFWKWWGKVAVEEGSTATFNYTNYPPVYLYILEGTSKVYSLIHPIDDSYWNENNFLYLLLIKLPYILSDLGIGWLIYILISNLEFGIWKTGKSSIQPRNLPLLASTFFLFNPAVIYNSSIWGQTDSLSAFLILLAFYCVFKNRYFLFAILAAINVFLKVQSLPFMGLAFIVIMKKAGTSNALKSIIPSIPTIFLINLPHILKHNLAAPIGVVINSLGYFPYASLNAYNLHWLLIKGSSDHYLDSQLVFGLISHKLLGSLLFITFVAILVRHLWKSLTPIPGFSFPELTTLFTVSLLTIFASFLFMTEIHERYFFPIYMFGTILVAVNLLKPKLYFLLSISGLLNLHLVMIQNYPENNLPIFNFLEIYRIPISLVLSLMNLLIFLAVINPVIKSLASSLKPKVKTIAGISAVIATILLIKAIQPKPKTIPLTSLSPSYWTQSYGGLTPNKSINGNLLAPAYYFHRNGIGTHANSQIDYILDSKFSRLTTSFGTDIESPDNASTIFKIALDDKIVFESPIMYKWTIPGFVDLPLNQTHKLSLLVTDAGDGINGDHADWLEPTLYQ